MQVMREIINFDPFIVNVVFEETMIEALKNVKSNYINC